MSTTGDERAGQAIRQALAADSLDFLELLAALRTALGSLLHRHEGAVHALLHREVRAGRVVPGPLSARGLTRYRLAQAPEAPEACAVAEPGPLGADVARHALRVAGALRDPAARGRVQGDVTAHLLELAATEEREGFGSARGARHLLERVAKGRAAVCLAATGADSLRRFLVHEGPWLLGAVAIYFFVQAFVMQVFQIPSSSMVPTLLVGDRVVVFKLGAGGTPERWSVVTFERAGTIYVKRVVGLPGEQLEIRNGDVWADGQRLVKPDDLNAALRTPVGAWAFGDDAPPGWHLSTDPGGTHRWRHGADFQPHGDTIRGNRYALRDGYLTFEAQRAAGGTVAALLVRGPGPDPAGAGLAWRLSLGERGVELHEIASGGGVEAERRLLGAQAAPAATGRVRLVLSYVDGILRASVGGWSFKAAREAPDEALRPHIEVRGEGCRPLRVLLDRDLHYAHLGTHGVPTGPDEPPNAHAIPAGRLFVMGDNTTNSTDSRFSEVGDIPVKDLIGPVRVRIWPPGRIGAVR